MPDVREVFEMSTKHARPTPGARDRQDSRQRRARRRRTGAAIVVAVLVVAVPLVLFMLGGDYGTNPTPLGSGSSSAPPSGPGPLGMRIVGLDGSVQVDLGLPRDAWTPALSPDGKRVAFVTSSTRVGFCGACVPGAVRLAVVGVGKSKGGYVYLGAGWGSGIDTVSQPAWSPNGKELAFQALRKDGNRDIYVADLAARQSGPPYFGVPVTRLTTDPSVDEFPAWSADGSTIYYDDLGTAPVESGMSKTEDIWSVPATGGTPTRLTYDRGPDAQPDAAPDGTIAYWHDGEIWTMTPDGTQQRRLSGVSGENSWNPRWSPDGTELALLHYDGGPRAYFSPNPIHESDLPLLTVDVVDVATGKVTVVGQQVASFYNPPSWTPDGRGLLVNPYG